jgi:hypothetical protein
MADWERMSMVEILEEVQKGGKFVVYQYCVSVVIMTFTRPSEIQFIRAGESRLSAGLPYVLASMVLGWWGFPFGFIFTPIAIITDLCGGKDVTPEIVGRIHEQLRRAQMAQQAQAANAAA